MFGGLGSNVVTLLAYLAFILLIFLALREVACWYWKINRMIQIQETQAELLRRIAEKLGADLPENLRQEATKPREAWE